MKQKPITQRLSFCALISMSFLLVGCLPLPKLINRVGGLGPEYPKEQIAIVKGSKHHFLMLVPPLYFSSTAKIQAVDGVYDYNADEVHISPGLHEMWISIEKGNPAAQSDPISWYKREYLHFKFNAEAGHTYKVHIPLYWRKNSIIEIIDDATKEVVGSQVASQ
jgi:hypothetical protein